MKISRLLYILLGIPFAYFTYYAFTHHGDRALFMVPFLVGLAATYVMSPHLDWMYAKRFPPKLPERFVDSLESNNFLYAQLSSEERKEFLKRVALIVLGKDFDSRPEHSIPFDVSHGLASVIATMTFYMKDFLIKEYEKVIVYKTSFPSPMYLKHVHACEVNPEDKVVLLATDKFMLGLNRPAQYFNTGYYVYAQALEDIMKPDIQFEKDHDQVIDDCCSVLGFKKSAVLSYIGLPVIDVFALSSTVFFMRNEALKLQFPSLFEQLRRFYQYPQ